MRTSSTRPTSRSEKLDKDVDETLIALQKGRTELLDRSKQLNAEVDAFEDDYLKNMSSEEQFTKSPMAMSRLINKVDNNSSTTLSSLAEASVSFKKVTEDLHAELTEIAIEDAENERIEDFMPSLPASNYMEKVTNASTKLSSIFKQGKTQYEIMEALAPIEQDHDVWSAAPKETPADGEDAMKSVENSLVAALHRKIQQLQQDLMLQTNKAHSLSVQWIADKKKCEDIKEKCRAEVELMTKKMKVDEYKNRHRELVARDSNMVPDSVSRAELNDAIAEIERLQGELAKAESESSIKSQTIQQLTSELNLVKLDYDQCERIKSKLEHKMEDLMRKQEHFTNRMDEMKETMEKQTIQNDLIVADLNEKGTALKGEIMEQKLEIANVTAIRDSLAVKNENLIKDTESQQQKIDSLKKQLKEATKVRPVKVEARSLNEDKSVEGDGEDVVSEYSDVEEVDENGDVHVIRRRRAGMMVKKRLDRSDSIESGMSSMDESMMGESLAASMSSNVYHTRLHDYNTEPPKEGELIELPTEVKELRFVVQQVIASNKVLSDSWADAELKLHQYQQQINSVKSYLRGVSKGLSKLGDGKADMSAIFIFDGEDVDGARDMGDAGVEARPVTGGGGKEAIVKLNVEIDELKAKIVCLEDHILECEKNDEQHRIAHEEAQQHIDELEVSKQAVEKDLDEIREEMAENERIAAEEIEICKQEIAAFEEKMKYKDAELYSLRHTMNEKMAKEREQFRIELDEAASKAAEEMLEVKQLFQCKIDVLVAEAAAQEATNRKVVEELNLELKNVSADFEQKLVTQKETYDHMISEMQKDNEESLAAVQEALENEKLSAGNAVEDLQRKHDEEFADCRREHAEEILMNKEFFDAVKVDCSGRYESLKTTLETQISDLDAEIVALKEDGAQELQNLQMKIDALNDEHSLKISDLNAEWEEKVGFANEQVAFYKSEFDILNEEVRAADAARVAAAQEAFERRRELEIQTDDVMFAEEAMEQAQIQMDALTVELNHQHDQTKLKLTLEKGRTAELESDVEQLSSDLEAADADIKKLTLELDAAMECVEKWKAAAEAAEKKIVEQVEFVAAASVQKEHRLSKVHRHEHPHHPHTSGRAHSPVPDAAPGDERQSIGEVEKLGSARSEKAASARSEIDSKSKDESEEKLSSLVAVGNETDIDSVESGYVSTEESVLIELVDNDCQTEPFFGMNLTVDMLPPVDAGPRAVDHVGDAEFKQLQAELGTGNLSHMGTITQENFDRLVKSGVATEALAKLTYLQHHVRFDDGEKKGAKHKLQLQALMLKRDNLKVQICASHDVRDLLKYVNLTECYLSKLNAFTAWRTVKFYKDGGAYEDVLHVHKECLMACINASGGWKRALELVENDSVTDINTVSTEAWPENFRVHVLEKYREILCADNKRLRAEAAEKENIVLELMGRKPINGGRQDGTESAVVALVKSQIKTSTDAPTKITPHLNTPVVHKLKNIGQSRAKKDVPILHLPGSEPAPPEAPKAANAQAVISLMSVKEAIEVGIQLGIKMHQDLIKSQPDSQSSGIGSKPVETVPSALEGCAQETPCVYPPAEKSTDDNSRVASDVVGVKYIEKVEDDREIPLQTNPSPSLISDSMQLSNDLKDRASSPVVANVNSSMPETNSQSVVPVTVGASVPDASNDRSVSRGLARSATPSGGGIGEVSIRPDTFGSTNPFASGAALITPAHVEHAVKNILPTMLGMDEPGNAAMNAFEPDSSEEEMPSLAMLAQRLYNSTNLVLLNLCKYDAVSIDNEKRFVLKMIIKAIEVWETERKCGECTEILYSCLDEYCATHHEAAMTDDLLSVLQLYDVARAYQKAQIMATGNKEAQAETLSMITNVLHGTVSHIEGMLNVQEDMVHLRLRATTLGKKLTELKRSQENILEKRLRELDGSDSESDLTESDFDEDSASDISSVSGVDDCELSEGESGSEKETKAERTAKLKIAKGKSHKAQKTKPKIATKSTREGEEPKADNASELKGEEKPSEEVEQSSFEREEDVDIDRVRRNTPPPVLNPQKKKPSSDLVRVKVKKAKHVAGEGTSGDSKHVTKTQQSSSFDTNQIEVSPRPDGVLEPSSTMDDDSEDSEESHHSLHSLGSHDGNSSFKIKERELHEALKRSKRETEKARFTISKRHSNSNRQGEYSKSHSSSEEENKNEVGEEKESLAKYDRRRVKIGAVQAHDEEALRKRQERNELITQMALQKAKEKKRKRRLHAADPTANNTALLIDDDASIGSEGSGSVGPTVVVKKRAPREKKQKKVIELFEDETDESTEEEVVIHKIKREKKPKKTKMIVQYSDDESVDSVPVEIKPKKKRFKRRATSQENKKDRQLTEEHVAPESFESNTVDKVSTESTTKPAPVVPKMGFMNLVSKIDNEVVKPMVEELKVSKRKANTKEISRMENRIIALEREVKEKQAEINVHLERAVMVDDCSQTMDSAALDFANQAATPEIMDADDDLKSFDSQSFVNPSPEGSPMKPGFEMNGPRPKLLPQDIQLIFVKDDEFHILPDVTIATKIPTLPPNFEVPPYVMFIHRRDLEGPVNQGQTYGQKKELQMGKRLSQTHLDEEKLENAREMFRKRGAVDNQLRSLGITKAARYATGLHNIELPPGIEAWEFPTMLPIQPGVHLISGATLGPLLDLPRDVLVLKLDTASGLHNATLPAGVDRVEIDDIPRIHPSIEIPDGMSLLYSHSPVLLPGGVDLGNGVHTVTPPDDLVLPVGVQLVKRVEVEKDKREAFKHSEAVYAQPSISLRPDLDDSPVAADVEDEKLLPPGFLPVETIAVDDEETAVHDRMTDGVVVVRKPKGISFPDGVEIVHRAVGHQFPPGMTPLPLSMYPDGLSLPESMELVSLDACIDLPLTAQLAPGIRAYPRPFGMSLPANVHLLLCEPEMLLNSSREFLQSGSAASLTTSASIQAESMMPPIGMMWVSMPILPSGFSFPVGHCVRAAQFLPGCRLRGGMKLSDNVAVAKDVDEIFRTNPGIAPNVTLVNRAANVCFPNGVERGLRTDVPVGSVLLGKGLEVARLGYTRYVLPAGVKLEQGVTLGRHTQLPPGTMLAPGIEVVAWPYSMILEAGCELVRIKKGYGLPFGYLQLSFDPGQMDLQEPLPPNVCVVRLPESVVLPSSQQLAELINIIPVGSVLNTENINRQMGRKRAGDPVYDCLDCTKPVLPEGCVLFKRCKMEQKSYSSSKNKVSSYTPGVVQQTVLPAGITLLPLTEYPPCLRSARLRAGAEIARITPRLSLPVGCQLAPGVVVASRPEGYLLPDRVEIVTIEGANDGTAAAKLPCNIQEVYFRVGAHVEPLLPNQKIVLLPEDVKLHCWSSSKRTTDMVPRSDSASTLPPPIAMDRLGHVLFKGIEVVNMSGSVHLPRFCFLVERPRRKILPQCLKTCYVNSHEAKVHDHDDYLNYLHPGTIFLPPLPPGVEIVKLQPTYELPRGVNIASLGALSSYLAAPSKPPVQHLKVKHSHHNGIRSGHYSQISHLLQHEGSDKDNETLDYSSDPMMSACYVKLATGQPIGGGIYVANRPPCLHLPPGIECLSMMTRPDSVVITDDESTMGENVSVASSTPDAVVEASVSTGLSLPRQPSGVARFGSGELSGMLSKQMSGMDPNVGMRTRNGSLDVEDSQGIFVEVSKWPGWLEEVSLKEYSKCFFVRNYKVMTAANKEALLKAQEEPHASANDMVSGNSTVTVGIASKVPEVKPTTGLMPPSVDLAPINEFFVKVIHLPELPGPRDREKLSFYDSINSLVQGADGEKALPKAVKLLENLHNKRLDFVPRDYVVVHPRIRKIWSENHLLEEQYQKYADTHEALMKGKGRAAKKFSRGLPDTRALDPKALLHSLEKSEKHVNDMELKHKLQVDEILRLHDTVADLKKDIDVLIMEKEQLERNEDSYRETIIQLKSTTAYSEKMAQLRMEDLKKARLAHEKTKEKFTKETESLHAQIEMWRDITPVVHSESKTKEETDVAAADSSDVVAPDSGVYRVKCNMLEKALADTKEALGFCISTYVQCFDFNVKHITSGGVMEGSSLIRPFPLAIPNARSVSLEPSGAIADTGVNTIAVALPNVVADCTPPPLEDTVSNCSPRVGYNGAEDDMSVLTYDDSQILDGDGSAPMHEENGADSAPAPLELPTCRTDAVMEYTSGQGIVAVQNSVGEAQHPQIVYGGNQLPVVPATTSQNENDSATLKFNINEELTLALEYVEGVADAKKSCHPIFVHMPVKEIRSANTRGIAKKGGPHEEPPYNSLPSLAQNTDASSVASATIMSQSTDPVYHKSRLRVGSPSASGVAPKKKKVIVVEETPLHKLKEWMVNSSQKLRNHMQSIRNACFNFVQAGDAEIESQCFVIGKLRKRVAYLEGSNKELEVKYSNALLQKSAKGRSIPTDSYGNAYYSNVPVPLPENGTPAEYTHYEQNKILLEKIRTLEHEADVARKYGHNNVLSVLEARSNEVRVIKDALTNCKFNTIMTKRKISENNEILESGRCQDHDRKAISHHNQSLFKKLLCYTERIVTLREQHRDLSGMLLEELRQLESKIQGAIPAEVLTTALQHGAQSSIDIKRKGMLLDKHGVENEAIINTAYQMAIGNDSASVDGASVVSSSSSVTATTTPSSVLMSKSVTSLPKSVSGGGLAALSATSGGTLRDRLAMLLAQERPLGQPGTMPLAPIVKAHQDSHGKRNPLKQPKAHYAAKNEWDSASLVSMASSHFDGESSRVSQSNIRHTSSVSAPIVRPRSGGGSLPPVVTSAEGRRAQVDGSDDDSFVSNLSAATLKSKSRREKKAARVGHVDPVPAHMMLGMSTKVIPSVKPKAKSQSEKAVRK